MTEGKRGWLDTRTGVVLLALLSTLPLLWPDFPPLIDLPGHMGRYAVQLRLEHSPVLQQWYGFEWQLIGNLGVDLLVIPLAPIFGLELSVKLIVILIPLLSTLGILWISREVHGHVSPAALLALPFIYGHPFMFGFVNFALSMAFALNAFALWLRLGRLHKQGLRAMLFVPIGLVIWVTHSFAWGVLGLLCFSAETVRNHDAKMGWIKAMFHAGIHCLSLAPPAVLMVMWRVSGAAGETGDWFDVDTKMIWFMMVFRDRWQWFDIGALIFVLVALYAIGRRKDFEFSRNLTASALLLAIAFICLPRIVFGSAYADMRLLPYVFIILLVALRPKVNADARKMGIVAMIAGAFFLVRLGGTTASFYLYDQRHDETLKALDHVPQNARVVTFLGRRTGLPWYTNREEHLPAFLIIRRNAFSNDQWVMQGAQLLTIKKPDAKGFVADPSQITKPRNARYEVWRTTENAMRRVPRQAFDYIWLIAPNEIDPALFEGLTLVWRNADSQLYRIDRPFSAALRQATPQKASAPARQGDVPPRTGL